MNSKYGIGIKIYEAKGIYEYNLGVCMDYYTKKSFIKNSLLLDFLKDNGLKVNGNHTDDIICINFGLDSRSYEKELENWEYCIEHGHSKKNPNKMFTDEDLEYFKKRRDLTERNKLLYCEKTKEEIREDFYRDGVDVVYEKRNKKNEVVSTKTIHYVYFFRSTGMAKVGKAMFINEKLYDRAIDFIQMGITLPKGEAKIVENSAYRSLIASAIDGRVKINPKNILVIEDVDSFSKNDVVLVGSNENKEIFVDKASDYDLKNTLFDGQGLIEASLVSNFNGYVLLRHHYCKMACFKTHIQKFFREYYGNDYYDATIKDIWGNEHYVRDIQVITTENAMKWLKLDATYDQWCKKVEENGCTFGIVKDAHPSKLGDVQKMSYQMINCLDVDIMDDVVEETLNYVYKLKSDDQAFLDYLDLSKNFSNDFEVLRAIALVNPEFVRSEYFRERKKQIINAYVGNVRKGKVIQNGDNIVIVGNPYAMLMHAVGEDPFEDPTFDSEELATQVWTSRFDDGKYLAEFRNPFNSANNLGYVHNHYHEYFDRYFDFCDNIVAVNMIGTDFQDRNNGSDQDSDSIYITDQEDIVEFARKARVKYPTIVNIIKPDKTKYNNDWLGYATVDNKIASSQEDIGVSSNTAQIAQTYACTYPNEQVYNDCCCILAVLAQVAIDSAKRVFWVDVKNEIRRISCLINVKDNKYPKFWKSIQDAKRHKQGRKEFDSCSINENLICPMNYLAEMKIPSYRSNESTLPMDYFFQNFELKENRKTSKRVEELIEKYSLEKFNFYSNQNCQCQCYDDGTIMNEDYISLMSNYEELINDIKGIYISNDYKGLMSWLINRAFMITSGAKRNIDSMDCATNKDKAMLLKTLYDINPQNVIDIFSKNLQK